MKSTNKIPKTALGRSARLMRGGAAILAKELSGRVRGALGQRSEESQMKTLLGQAEQLVGTLGDMKGAAMKAGQILSIEASDYLPQEVLDILRRLHDSAPGMSIEDVERILLKELGAERRARIKDLSAEPIAAASIGQVHTAVVDGRQIVLKIQFPGVATSIDTDLGMLKKIAQTIITLQGKTMSLDPLFAELARGLRNEVDYCLEARALQTYKDAFAHDSRYVVPDVFPDLTTPRVLAMSRVDGLRIKDWLASNPTQDERNAICQLVLDLVRKEFFDLGLVQTDPNYGNFFIQPDTHRLVLLDFGALQSYPAEIRDNYRKLLKVGLHGDRDDIITEVIHQGLVDPREDYETKALVSDLVEHIVTIFDASSQPFYFGDTAYIEATREQVLEIARRVRLTSPPQQLVFLNRKMSGMYHLLKEVGCHLDTLPFLNGALNAG